MIHGHARTVFGIIVICIVLFSFTMLASPQGKPEKGDPQNKGPKLSQASLDLDTCGCPTTFGPPYCDEETEWYIEKFTNQGTMEDPDGEAYLFDVKVEEGPTGKKLKGTGQIVVTNSGEYSAELSSVVLLLEKAGKKGDAPGPSGKNWHIVETALEVEAAACDNQGKANTCYGTLLETPGSKLVLLDPDNNDIIALSNVLPIPATMDNDGDGKRDEDGPEPCWWVDNDGDGYYDEDPPNNLDDDNDGKIDEDGPDDDLDGYVDEDGVCEDSVKINFEYEFDISNQSLENEDLRLDLLVTFGSAGARGNSPQTTSCTADINCNNQIDVDDPNTPLVDEGEEDNIRTVQQRYEFTLPQCGVSCDKVKLVDTGAEAEDEDCVDLTTSTLNKMIQATGTAGKKHYYNISGTVTCDCDNGGQQNVAPMLYGTDRESSAQNGGGDIYAIDPVNKQAFLLVDISTKPTSDNLPISPITTSSPNGNAYDVANDRFYFTTFTDPANQNAPKSKLYFVYLNNPNLIHKAGELDGYASDGAFHNGKFYYISAGSFDLKEVTFDQNGIKVSESKIATIPANDSNTAWLGFGDLEVECNGLFYLSATKRDNTNKVIGTLSGTYDIDNNVLTPWNVNYAYQIALAGNKLYGHDAGTGKTYIINKTTGATLSVMTGDTYTDLTGNKVCGEGCDCQTTVSNTAELICFEDQSLVSGSPASASFEVICGEGEPGIEPGDFCTQTNGGWGAEPQGNNVGTLLHNNFAQAFGNGLIVGDPDGPDNDVYYSILLTSAQAVTDYLPAGGPPKALTADQTDPLTTSSNIFGGQLTAAAINIKFDELGIRLQGNPVYPPGTLKNLTLKQGCVTKELVGKSVNEVFAMSNCAIQNGSINLKTVCGVPSGVDRKDLNNALNVINLEFDNCNTALGCLELPSN